MKKIHRPKSGGSAVGPLSSIFITPELLVRIEQNQRHSIGNGKVGIESADEKNPPPPSGGSEMGPLSSISITP